MQELTQKKTAEVGVIIGRFQVHDLHRAHIDLIIEVQKRHKRVIVMIGSTPGVKVSRRNPLDYHTRMLMIQKKFPNSAPIIIPLNDHPCDKQWSSTVDSKIAELFDFETTALLYGSRDGFIPYYCGKHQTVELAAKHKISGSSVRKMVSDEVRAHSEFRRGCVYAAFNRHKVVYQTVDIAIINYDTTTNDGKVVLGRKRTDPTGKYRFPGGFVNPEVDDDLESAAGREGREEVRDVAFSNVKFVCSKKINDWRYKNEADKIMTCFFTATYMYGPINPGDDLDEVQWFPINSKTCENIIDEHKTLFEKLLKQQKN